MRINRIYIDSFGTLNSFEYKFDSNLNTILEENGFGKTTLAVFIKCMFYGIKGGNKAGLSDENERIKYIPWGSTNLIGGILDFEIDDKSYRIERYFGDKPSMDTFKLINLKTNKPSEDYTKDIGLELFGVDVNGFERSTYIPQKALDNNTGNLTTKITNLFGNTDFGSIDQVIKNIEDNGKLYYRSNGKSGYIADTKKSIVELETRIKECENYENSSNLLTPEIDEVNAKILNISNKLSELKVSLEKAIKSAALQKEYNQLISEVESVKNRYVELKNIFENKEINMEVLDGMITLSKELIKIDSKIEYLETSSEETLEKYSMLFATKTPDIEEIDKYIVEASSTSSNTQPKWFMPSIISLVAVLMASIGLYFVNTILGVVFTIIPLVAIITILLLNKNTNTTDNISHIKDYLSQYGYTNNNYIENLHNLKSEVMLYTKLLATNSEKESQLSELKSSKTKILDAITPYIHNFYDKINDDYTTLLEDIKNDYKEYTSLMQNLDKLQSSMSRYDKDIDNTLDLSKLRSEELEYRKELESLNSTRIDLITRQNTYLERANIKSDLIQELSIANEKLIDLLTKYNTLVATADYIRQAKEEVCSKYLKPISDNILKHFRNISADTKLNISIDTDLNINVIDNNIDRNIEYYSKGYKDIFNICLRFALLDTLFSDTKPFVILDDPFINLDDTKSKNMLQVLDSLSKEYQIIYLTCSSSRTKK